jgi:hypothetical protein
MVGYINLEERVERYLRLARRKALLGRIGARLRRGVPSEGCFASTSLRSLPG